MYPGEVEFRLYTDVFAFFLVLGAENLELFWFEWAVHCHCQLWSLERIVGKNRVELCWALQQSTGNI